MNSLVQKAYDNLKRSQTVKFELNEETIDKIASIIKQALKAFQECQKTPEQATVSVNNPTRSDKAVLKKAIRRELGFFGNLREGGEYYDAVLKAGYTANVNEVQEVYFEK
jgi:hypothetical protein